MWSRGNFNAPFGRPNSINCASTEAISNMKLLTRLAWFAGAAALALAQDRTATLVAVVAPTDWVLANVNVVDLEQGQVLAGRALHIRDGKIAGISVSQIPGPKGEPQPVDGGGAFVIPGLYDMHVHLAGRDGKNTSNTGLATALTRHIQQGVLGVRDMGFPVGSLPALVKLANGPRDGAVPAPRVWFVGPILNAPSTTTFPEHVQVSDVEAIDSIVSQIAAAGAMAVKVHDRLSRDAYRQVFAAARARGLRVVGHIPAAVPIDDVIAERHHTIEHLGGLTHGILMACSRDIDARERAVAATVPEDFRRLFEVAMTAGHLTPLLDGFDADLCVVLARRLRTAGSWQVPTMVMWKAFARAAGTRMSKPLTADDIAARRRLHSIMSEVTRIFHREGVPLMTGSDGIGSIHDELAALVEAGLPPVDALRAATEQPARFLGLTSSGAVKPGYAADLVLLADNPLADIGNTRRVVGVVVSGRHHEVTPAPPTPPVK
jgi:imidazolonepropionase-like amidohydrolase